MKGGTKMKVKDCMCENVWCVKPETKINEMVSEHNEEICNKLLANQLRLPESSQSYEDRLYFWKRFPFTAKFSIFTKVQYMLGLTEQNNEELFPTRE